MPLAASRRLPNRCKLITVSESLAPRSQAWLADTSKKSRSRAHHRFAALAQGARRDPDARRHLRHQGHSASASGRTIRSYARIEVRADTAEQLERHPRRHPRLTGPCRFTPPIARPSPPTWTGPFPRGSTARPTSAPQVRLGGEWIDVEDQEMDCGIVVDPEGGTARCVADDRRAAGRSHRRRPRRACASFPPRRRHEARTCSSSWPARSRARSPRA